MKSKFNPDECVFLIESGRFIREVKVLKYTGGLYTIRFLDGAGGMKVRENRLYATKADAEAALPKSDSKPQTTVSKRKSPWDY